MNFPHAQDSVSDFILIETIKYLCLSAKKIILPSPTLNSEITAAYYRSVDKFKKVYGSNTSNRILFCDSNKFMEIIIEQFEVPIPDLDIEKIKELFPEISLPTPDQLTLFYKILVEEITNSDGYKEKYKEHYEFDALVAVFETNTLVSKISESLSRNDIRYIQPILYNDSIDSLPYYILDFRSQSFGLVGRDKELEAISQFFETSLKFCWWSVIGKAGIGKSKLLWEVSKNYNHLGKYAGFIQLQYSQNFNWQVWQPIVDTLIVVDDVVIDLQEAKRVINILTTRNDLNFKVRILVNYRETEIQVERIFQDPMTLRYRYGKPLQLDNLNDEQLYDIFLIARDTSKLPVDKNQFVSILAKIDELKRPIFAILLAEVLFAYDTVTVPTYYEVFKYYFISQYERWKNISSNLQISEESLNTHLGLLSVLNICGPLDLVFALDNNDSYKKILPDLNTYNKKLYSQLINVDLIQINEVLLSLKPDIISEFFVLEIFEELNFNIYEKDLYVKFFTERIGFSNVLNYLEKTLDDFPLHKQVPFIIEIYFELLRKEDNVFFYKPFFCDTLRGYIKYCAQNNRVDLLREILNIVYKGWLKIQDPSVDFRPLQSFGLHIIQYCVKIYAQHRDYQILLSMLQIAEDIYNNIWKLFPIDLVKYIDGKMVNVQADRSACQVINLGHEHYIAEIYLELIRLNQLNNIEESYMYFNKMKELNDDNLYFNPILLSCLVEASSILHNFNNESVSVKEFIGNIYQRFFSKELPLINDKNLESFYLIKVSHEYVSLLIELQEFDKAFVVYKETNSRINLYVKYIGDRSGLIDILSLLIKTNKLHKNNVVYCKNEIRNHLSRMKN